jgi:hypothetical protein
MPAVPDWLTPIFQQFPIVGLVFGTAWLSVRWAEGRHVAEIDRLRGDSDRSVARADALAAMCRDDRLTAERLHHQTVANLIASHERQLAQAQRRIRELERRLDRRTGT